jgi:hypothetical protein
LKLAEEPGVDEDAAMGLGSATSVSESSLSVSDREKDAETGSITPQVSFLGDPPSDFEVPFSDSQRPFGSGYYPSAGICRDEQEVR